MTHTQYLVLSEHWAGVAKGEELPGVGAWLCAVGSQMGLPFHFQWLLYLELAPALWVPCLFIFLLSNCSWLDSQRSQAGFLCFSEI